MQYDAYKRANSATEKPSQTEYRLFAEITRELEQAMSSSAAPTDRILAAFRNSQLWLTLKTDLISEQNKLDVHIKAGLISLAIWVEKLSAEAIRGEIDLSPLIDVNKDIMQGLSQSNRNARTKEPSHQNAETQDFKQAVA